MIGQRIQELREANGMTQSALARQLGLSRSAINAWEMGISIPSTRYVVELAQLFRVSADYILEIGHSETIDLSCLDSEEKELIYGMMRQFRRRSRCAAQPDRREQEQLRADYTALCRAGVQLPVSLRRLAEQALEGAEE